MKHKLYILIFFGHFIITHAQTNQIQIDYDEFRVSLSNNIEKFDTAHVVLKNPYFSNEYENSGEKELQVKNFPISYSVLYGKYLISLFENGKFSCFNIDDFKRDISLEHKLNVRKFRQHWIIDGKLGGLSGNSIFLWDDHKWIKYKKNFPLKNQPKLFEDEKSIAS
ncbi:hypothetical protein CHU92_01065 [Flavobacterium cyanobacteriorum]|uniref:WG repeat-containing protein n=1 Tax=Flavobacterium cyanobacteriorum TaxID=2022802 RepID=A0A256A2Q6_9FLAO|nr:hypothetical protein [Flavobacterium cyanobacteriorum]OYQ47415.1 hypothetical protein CHU92_01065 [Flavobacterium cyanobacteriorum]